VVGVKDIEGVGVAVMVDVGGTGEAGRIRRRDCENPELGWRGGAKGECQPAAEN
jgi:hypothetical protein